MNVRRQTPRIKGDGMEARTTTLASAVLDQLRQLEYRHVRPNEILTDFTRLSVATLEMIPAHTKSIAQTGRLAQDDKETAELFVEIKAKYGSYYHHIEQAFTLLLHNANLYGVECPDLIGLVWELYGYMDARSGQFFTPWGVCMVMAKLMDSESDSPMNLLLSRLYAYKTNGGVLGNLHPDIRQLVEFSLRAKLQTPNAMLEEGWFVSMLKDSEFKPVLVYDPSVGSGRCLLAPAALMPFACHAFGLVQFYAQDIDLKCVLMCRLNFLLYGLNGWGARFWNKLSYQDAVTLLGGGMKQPLPRIDIVWKGGKEVA